MQSNALTPDAYIASLPDDRKAAMEQLRTVLKENLPAGFEEVMGYGMLGYVVPHSRYPAGYHCDPKQPLPFINVASQKNHIAIYHMGLYMTGELLDWFVAQWETVSRKKLDMGKSCIRFKKPEDIPYGLIGELATKLTPEQWIARYEKALKR
ncbi:hypothetical protein D3C86_1166900 [compost metagenome]